MVRIESILSAAMIIDAKEIGHRLYPRRWSFLRRILLGKGSPSTNEATTTVHKNPLISGGLNSRNLLGDNNCNCQYST